MLICDPGFFEMNPPANKVEEYKANVSSVEKVIVGGAKGGASQVFKGEVSYVDPHSVDV